MPRRNRKTRAPQGAVSFSKPVSRKRPAFKSRPVEERQSFIKEVRSR